MHLPFLAPDVVVTEGWFRENGDDHRGIDYDSLTLPTFAVLAADGGRAIWSYNKDLGFFVYVAHNEMTNRGRLVTLYAHLAENSWPTTLPRKTPDEVGDGRVAVRPRRHVEQTVVAESRRGHQAVTQLGGRVHQCGWRFLSRKGTGAPHAVRTAVVVVADHAADVVRVGFVSGVAALMHPPAETGA